MRRKLCIVGLFALLVILLSFSGPASAAAGQQVKIPYVISSTSGTGWWTGIAITNNDNETISDMELQFYTDQGASYYEVVFKTGSDPDLELDPGLSPVKIYYKTDLAEISPFAMLVNTVDGFYTGEGTKTLPTDTGSILLYHTGTAEFSVTVYIGNSEGFAFQVFNSSAY